MHAQVEEHLGDGHLHQGGEVHENTEDHSRQVAQDGVFTGEELNPFGADDLTDDADRKHTHQQQGEDLFNETPRFPDPVGAFLLAEGFLDHDAQNQHEKCHANCSAGDLYIEAARVGQHFGGCHQQSESQQSESSPRPEIGAVVDFFESPPGEQGEQQQQDDQQQSLGAYAFFAFGRVEGDQGGERVLQCIHALNRQRELRVGVGEKVEFQGARDEQRHHQQQKEGVAFAHFSTLRKGVIRLRFAGGVFLAEDQGHDHADADAEGERQEQPGESQVRADGHTGVSQRQDVGGWRKEQKSDGGPQTGSLFINAGEKRNDGAGADRQQRTGGRRRGVGDVFGRLAPQKTHDRFARDERRHAAGDEEGRQQAEQHVRGKI